MIIKLSPVRYDVTYTLTKQGDTLIINDEPFDFSPLQEGDLLPLDSIKSEWFAGDVTRTNGELIIPLLFPHGINAPYSSRYPAPLLIAKNGPIDLPVFDEDII